MSRFRFAGFHKNGNNMYFPASNDIRPTTDWLDLSSINRPVSRSVYVIVLRKDLPSPIPFESDEEEDQDIVKDGDPAKKDPAKRPVPRGKDKKGKDKKGKDKKDK